MNDEEKTFEAVRVCHILDGIMKEKKYEASEKFRKATKYPYILRFDYTDDRMNKWRILFILQNKWYKKKKLFRTMAYTTYEVPPKREKDYLNAGKGVLLYDPPAMLQAIDSVSKPNKKMAAVGDIVPQDIHLAANQQHGVRCGDNGIFRGVPPTEEQRVLTHLASEIYKRFPYDGKYIIHGERKQYTTVTGKPIEGKFHNVYGFTICQSHMSEKDIMALIEDFPRTIFPPVTIGDNDDPFLSWHYNLDKCKFNPLGEWTGGPNTDSGATNRKLGSDMGEGVTGGGLHGKDLSKGDVSINIACYLKAVQSGQTVTACCSIGDEQVTFVYAGGKTETETFRDVVEMARLYILTVGGFEKFAEWGLVRPLAQVKSEE